MARQFTVVIERDDEGYLVGSVPDLKGCHTQATSMDELLDRMREAILLCLDVQGEEATAPSTSSGTTPSNTFPTPVLSPATTRVHYMFYQTAVNIEGPT